MNNTITRYQKMLEYNIEKYNEMEYQPLDGQLDFFKKQWDEILTDKNRIEKIKEEIDLQRKDAERIEERIREARKTAEERYTKEKEKKYIIEKLAIQYCFFIQTLSSLMTNSFCNPSADISKKLLLFDSASKKLVDHINKQAFENNITRSDIEKEIKRINNQLPSDEIKNIFLNHFIGIKAMAIFKKNPDMFNTTHCDMTKQSECYYPSTSSISDLIDALSKIDVEDKNDNNYYDFSQQQSFDSFMPKFKNARYAQPQYIFPQINIDFQVDNDEKCHNDYLKRLTAKIQ